MGWNTTIVVMNDALDDVANEPEIGERIRRAVVRQHMTGGRVDISARGYANAMAVIEQHHADYQSVIAVGGNTGTVLGYGGGFRAAPEEMLRTLADSMGFRLVRKPKVRP